MSSAPAIVPKSMGTALNRVDGRLKVTGAAKYPVEFNPPNAAYAFLVPTLDGFKPSS
jgi:xanthine dehydrogenase YagR molybdenum-binding subunit